MRIFLDTNILRRDFRLASREFEMLFDYLGRTDARVIFPSVVLDELEGLYSERLRELTNGIGQLHATLVNPDEALGLSLSKIDVVTASKAHRAYVLQRFGVQESDVLPYVGAHLPEVTRRAIHRIPPITKKGEEFRDALIWLAVLDEAEASDQKTAVLISDDRGFSENRGVLSAPLMQEAESRGVRVVLYNTIGDFIKARSEKSAYITSEWLEQEIVIEDFEDQLRADIGGFFGSQSLLRWLRDNTRAKDLGSSSYQLERGISADVEDFFVYEMSDESFRVKATYRCRFEVTYEDSSEVQWTWESESDTAFPVGVVDAWDFPRSSRIPRPLLRSVDPVVLATVYIVVRAGELESVELDEWLFE